MAATIVGGKSPSSFQLEENSTKGHHEKFVYSREELIEKFGPEEYVIFGLTLLISLLIGLYYAWKGQKDNKEFLLGGKSMGILPMTMSLVASFMSAITMLGTPAEIYQSGTQYITLVLAYPIIMAVTVSVYLPVFWKLQVSTSYEYLEWRFNKATRILGSACFIVQMVLYMSIVVYAPALALAQITGFKEEISSIVIFIVCIMYTAIGGIKAVMWTDTFQLLVMFGSFLAVIIKGNYDAGGASQIFDRNYQSGRVQLFNFDTDMTVRHTLWSTILGGFFTWLSVYAVNQTQVQRYLTVKSKERAVKSIWYNSIGIGSLLLMCAYAGMTIFAYYDANGCDPIKSLQVDKPDQLFPLFVLEVMGDIPCVPGLFVAGVFSGALSTVSSGLNSLAAVTLQDFVLSGCRVNISETKKTYLSKALATIYGIIAYGILYLVKYLPGVLQAALGIFGIIGGPVLGMFTLGMLVPWANGIGAFTASFSSLIFTMWFGFGQTVAKYYNTLGSDVLPTTVENCPEEWLKNATIALASRVKPDPSEFHHLRIYEVSYMWFSAIPCMWTVVFGTIISFLTGPTDPRDVNPDCISPALPKLFAIWPKPVRKFFKEGLQLGSRFSPGAKEKMLKSQQIGNDEATPEMVLAATSSANVSNHNLSSHTYDEDLNSSEINSEVEMSSVTKGKYTIKK